MQKSDIFSQHHIQHMISMMWHEKLIIVLRTNVFQRDVSVCFSQSCEQVSEQVFVKESAHKTGLTCVCLIKKVLGDWKVNSDQGRILKSISTVYLQFTAGKVRVDNKWNGHLFFLAVKLRSPRYRRAVFKSKTQPQEIYHVSFQIDLFPAAANKVWNAESNFEHVKSKSDVQ